MIGNRVKVIFVPTHNDAHSIVGTLHKLDGAGAIIWRENTLPEGQGNVFIPMHRIHEIVDLGRAP